MMRRAVCLLTLAALTPGILSSVQAGSGAAPRSEAFTLQAEPDGWTLRYSQTRIPSGSLTIDGTPHVLFTSAPAAVPADSGSPQLPVETVSLGVPFGSSITVELVDPVYQESANILVAPVPRYRKTAEGGHEALYLKDGAAYAADRFYPARTLWSDPPFVFRQQQIVTIHLAPVLYNPSKKILRRLMSGGIRIRTIVRGPGKGAAQGAAAGVTDVHFENVFKNLILNYDQAKQWRRSGAKGTAATGADPTRDWFVPGATYYRIPVVADGWYRLSKADIANAGGTIDTGTAALWYRGTRIPLVVRNDSSLEFYATRNRGDSTYFDYYTDTSSYWLTWGGTPGARFGSSAAPGAPITSNLLSVLTTVHQEQNNLLYQGTDESELTNSGAVPGKGWLWEFYYPSTQYTHTFTVDSIDQTAATAVIRVRLFSTTPHYQNPDHIARFWLNDSLVGSVSFNGRTEGRFNVTFPARLLAIGTNRLRILSD
ncbi:MAG TPA: C25 family peptidase propeptide domain-containing protein, partial [Bacteroidota bacterium]